MKKLLLSRLKNTYLLNWKKLSDFSKAIEQNSFSNLNTFNMKKAIFYHYAIICCLFFLPLIAFSQSSTCVPGSVENGNKDLWSEECYLKSDCTLSGNPCQANEVNVFGAYFADINGDPISTCIPGEEVTGYLWAIFNNTSGTDRYAVRTRLELFVNGVYDQEILECSFNTLSSGQTDAIILGPISYKCGDNFELQNIWVGWSTSSGDQCLDDEGGNYASECGDYPASKCWQQIKISVLSPNFSYACGDATETTTQICFTDLSSGGNPVYTYSWDFGDMSGTSTLQNPCYTYSATTGIFDVVLTVTDSDLVSASAILTVDLNDLNCCSFTYTCPTFPPSSVNCYADLPTQTNYTEAEFEALGNGDGNIGDNACGVVEITASNTPLACEGFVTRTYTITEYKDSDGDGIKDDPAVVLNTETCTQSFTVDFPNGPSEDGDPVETSGGIVECIADATAPTTLPVIKDACGNTLSPADSDPQIGGTYTDCEGTRTFTYNYQDCAGNPFTWTYTYTIDLTTNPSEDGGPVSTSGGIVECIADATAPTTLPVIKDACGNTLSPAASDPQIGGTYSDCEGTRTFTYNYQDCAGNPFTWTYTYTIDLTTNPSEDGGPVDTSGGIVECIADATAPTTLPVIKDACGNTLSPAASDPQIGGTYTDCEGTRTFTYNYTDCANNPFTWTYTYTIDLTTNPSEDGGPVDTSGGTVECLDDATAPTTLPVIKDACGNTLSPAASDPQIGGTYTDCEGTRTFTYNYTDCANNPFTWTYTYTIDLTTNPSEDGGPVDTSGGTVECLDDATAPTTLPVIKDACGNTLSPAASDPQIGGTYTDCEGTRTFIYNYTDCANNPFTWTYTYTIDLTTNPSEDGGPVDTSGGTVECLDDATAPTTLPVIKDACGNTLSPADSDPQIGGTYTDCEGTRTFTYNYTDCANNPFTWTYTYNIDLTSNPSEDGGPVDTSGGTVECLDDATAPTTLPVIKDACGNTLSPADSDPQIGGTYTDCEGTRTFTYNYTDCANNPFTWTYTYNIDLTSNPSEDGGPVDTSGGTVECLDDATAPTTLPVIKDACGNTLSPADSDPQIGGTYTDCEGTRTFTYNYTDCANNPFTWTYTYTIDLTSNPSEDGGPVSTSGGTIECLADATPPTTLPVIKDACGNTLSPADSDPQIGGTYTDCEGTRTFTYNYTDCANNPFTWTYTYTIDLTSNPSEDGGPVDTSGGTVECLDDATAPTTLPVIKDACGNTLSPAASDPQIGGTYSDCEGTRTFTYNYQDCADNPFEWVYTYNIDISTAPDAGTDVTHPSTIECITDATAPTTLPNVTEVCGNQIIPTGPVEGGTYIDCEGTKTFTYTYTDCSGLFDTWTYTYNIDIEANPPDAGPDVTHPSTIECLADATAPTTLPVVKDACDNNITPTGPVEGGTYTDCEGTKTFTYTYTDCSGLFDTWTYTYNIDLTTSPVEEGGPVSASGGTVECIADATVPTTLPVIKDICGNTLSPAATDPQIGGTYSDCEGTRTFTYNYQDCAGNPFTWTYTYTIDLTSNPSEDGGPVDTSGGTVECLDDATAPTTLPVIKDACGNTLSPADSDPQIGGTYSDCEGTRTFTYNYTDCANNPFTWTYTYTINLTTNPSEDGDPVDTSGGTVECLDDATAPTTLPVIKDACGNTLSPAASDPQIGGTYSDCEGTRTFTYNYQDCADNSFEWVYTYNIDISTAPDAGTDATHPSTIECITDATAPTTLPNVTDVCDNQIIPTGPVEGGTYIDCEGYQNIYLYLYRLFRFVRHLDIYL